MRGIQINNYYNNQITLNGRKINNNHSNCVVQTSRPKPLIIDHVHPHSPQPMLLTETKSPMMGKGKQKIIVGGSTQKKQKQKHNNKMKTNKKNKKEDNLNGQMKGIMSAKRSNGSSSRQKSRERLGINKNHSKSQPNRIGLGKRSKSAIIKSTVNIEKQGNISRQNRNKKNPIIITNKSLNISNSARKQKIGKASSLIKIHRKGSQRIKPSKFNSQKKSARITNKMDLLQIQKPTSARQRKFSYQRRLFMEKINKVPLFDNVKEQKRTEQKRDKEHKGNEYKNDKEQKGDKEIQRMVGQIQFALSNISSSRQNKKQLKIITEKLKNMVSEGIYGQKEKFIDFGGVNESSQDQSHGMIEKESQHTEQLYDQNQGNNPFISSEENQLSNQKNIINDEINSNNGNNSNNSKQRNHQQYYLQYLQEQQSKVQNQNQILFEKQGINIVKGQSIQQKIEQQDSSCIKSNKLFNNPILEKRLNHINIMEDLHCQEKQNSIQQEQQRWKYEQYEEDKQQKLEQIQKLKKFKQQSTKLMEKVKKYGERVKKEENSNKEHKSEEKPSLQIMTNIASNNNNDQLTKKIQSPSSLKDDIYPIQSPKFNKQQLFNIVSMKQKFNSNKHNKMTELVDKLYEKQLVSPKSYEHQILILQRKKQEEHYILQGFKKQAQELSNILKDIKQDKDQIKGIDQIIRKQDWSKAITYVSPNSKTTYPKYGTNEQQHHKKNHYHHEQHKSQDLSEGWQRVYPEQSNNILANQKANQNENENNNDINNAANNEIMNKNISKFEEQNVSYSNTILQNNLKQQQQCVYYDGNDEGQSSAENNHETGLIQLLKVCTDDKEQEQQCNIQSLVDKRIIHIDQTNEIDQDQTGQIDEDFNEIELNQNSHIGKKSNYISQTKIIEHRNGFDSNLYFIKQYCIALCEYIRDDNVHKNHFKINIKKSLHFNLIDLLKGYRLTSLGQHTRNYNCLKDDIIYKYIHRKIQQPVITDEIFNSFNVNYNNLKYQQQNVKQSCAEEKELERIFLLSIRNALNHSLDYQRPGGIHGVSLPWKSSSKHLKNLKYKIHDNDNEQSTQTYDYIFGVAIARLIQWSSVLCGFLPDTVDLENTEIDEEYVSHIRQTRMALILDKMIQEQEHFIQNKEMEQTEIYLHVSEIVMTEIMKEITVELNDIICKTNIY